MLKSLFAIALFVSLCLLVRSDLPVHCLKSQAVGTWTIEQAKSEALAAGEYATCGHEQPDSETMSAKAGVDGFVANRTFIVILHSNSVAEKIDGDTTTKGNWTMIYDEGLDIIFPTERYTNFFYYYTTTPLNYASNCGKTTVGWYINSNGERACWRAEKNISNSEDADDLVGEETEQKNIVQPKEYQTQKAKEPLIQVQMSSSHTKRKINRLDSDGEQEKVHVPIAKRSSKYNKEFKNHKEIVDKINSNDKKTWKAKAYPEFNSKTIGDLNKMAGRKAAKKHKPAVSFIEKMSNNQSDVSDLPKEWSWESSLGGMKEQGDCGSCYLVATLEMLEARLRIFYEEDVTLSIQYPLDCSYYNQGCDGGYPYLAGLFANQYPMVPEACAPYLGEEGVCGDMCNVTQLEKVYKVSNFRFVGGSYGDCDERSMMLELMNYGPMIANFEPTNDFMYYEGGVYSSEDATWKTSGEEKPEWEKVDHSVLLFGWGETDDGLKYWILRNSWGPYWGENGNFRMKRGVDESAIESYAEASDPVVVYQ